MSDLIERQAVLDILERESHKWGNDCRDWKDAINEIKNLPRVDRTVQEFVDKCIECGRQKRCKDCKYFEYDSVAKVDGIPLIVAHEICTKWGDGCKTKEDGYCFMFEPQESEE